MIVRDVDMLVSTHSLSCRETPHFRFFLVDAAMAIEHEQLYLTMDELFEASKITKVNAEQV